MENRMKVPENRVLRKTFLPKKDEVIGGAKILFSEELHYLYSSPNIMRMM
jgi:hypothetical protein